jgi:hypothetical protein
MQFGLIICLAFLVVSTSTEISWNPIEAGIKVSLPGDGTNDTRFVFLSSNGENSYRWTINLLMFDACKLLFKRLVILMIGLFFSCLEY